MISILSQFLMIIVVEPRFLVLKIQLDREVVIAIIATLIGVGISFLLVGFDLLVNNARSNGAHLFVNLIGVGLLSVAGIVIVLYFSTDEIIKHYRKDRFRRSPNRIKVGVLSGTSRWNIQNPCQFHGGPPTPHVTTPQEWMNFFEYHFFQAEMIDTSEINNRYALIVNPFGERYPEEDFATRRSFHKIKKYIKEGGIFVNTSGLAFYYMWDSYTGQQQPTGQPLETYVINRNFILEPVELAGQTSVSHSWLTENFKVRTTIGGPSRAAVYQSDLDIERCGDIANIGGATDVEEYRAAVYGPDLIPLLRCQNQTQTMECYPLAATKLGLGYLIVVGFTPNSIGWTEKIKNALLHICVRIMRKGSIE